MQGMQQEEYGKGSLNDYIQALAAALGALLELGRNECCGCAVSVHTCTTRANAKTQVVLAISNCGLLSCLCLHVRSVAVASNG